MNLPLPALPDFDYLRPGTREEALAILQKGAMRSRPVLGGTDLLVQLRSALMEVDALVDIKLLPGMLDIDFSSESGLEVGAGVTMNRIAGHAEIQKHYPVLAEGARSVASYQLRNRATIGGNLCNASPAADAAPASLVLEAELTAWGQNGERRIPILDFFRGPGESALEPDELLLRIHFPIPPGGSHSRYLKLGRNAQGDLAIVSVAILGFPDPSAESGFGFRIAIGSAAPTPIRAPQAEDILSRAEITEDTIDEAARAARDATRPIDDLRASARYRREMAHALTRRGLIEIWTRLKEDRR
jgi:CO/xanthine dehydrogenase FAD-binding subunit